jgi:hypothetical protein
MMDSTYRSNLATKTQKVLNPFHALSNTYYGGMEPISTTLPALYQAGSGHFMELSIGRMMNLGK